MTTNQNSNNRNGTHQQPQYTQTQSGVYVPEGLASPRKTRNSEKKEVNAPGFDVGAIAELIFRFILFLRSPQGIVMFLFPILIWIAWSNINQYPPVLRLLGLSTAMGLTWGCFFYWVLLQCLQLVGGISFASTMLQATGYLVERGRSIPDPDPRSSKLAHRRSKSLNRDRDSQKMILWMISGSAYLFDIITISMTRGAIVSSFGDFNFPMVFQVAWISTAFDVLTIILVIVGENIPNRTVRDFLVALRRGEVVKMPGQVGDWKNRHQ